MQKNDRNDLTSGFEYSLGEALNSQPILAPNHSAWLSIQSTMKKKSARNKLFFSLTVPTFAIIAAATIAFSFFYRPVFNISPQTVSELIHYSQQLETELKNLEAITPLYDASTAAAITELEDTIALVDLQLAGPIERKNQAQALWQQRVVLMENLSTLHAQQIRTVSYTPVTQRIL